MAVLIGKNLLSLILENKFLSAALNRQSYGQQIVHFSIFRVKSGGWFV